MLAEHAQGAEHQEMGCVPVPVLPALGGEVQESEAQSHLLDRHRMNMA